ncbi:hypothetical protein [Pseudomonas baltica]|uniref:DUF4365 domain-containing protein n=1 Tax=Pseudomonas baltica TaxID=2762576 RepID=A0A7X1G8T5_9PSED|nr:hypothetical protein [Pseudomonas baltica]MBC2680618.1 hypothetical protein [Pseudomonas baltica]
MRNIGSAGEGYFCAWCSSAGLTANKSVSDEHGWDILIELDDPNVIDDPLTMHEGVTEVKVQIKSTDTNKQYVDVELSNLRKMATSVLPTFYILIQFEKHETPSRVYIRHVDKELISEILKKITALKAKEANPKLNKKTMRINFSEEIIPLTPSQLKSRLKTYLGTSAITYTAEKTRHLASAGFEKNLFQVDFKISSPDQLQNLLDASLGKKIDVAVDDLNGHAIRFGQRSPFPKLSASNAVLQILSVVPDDSGRVTFKNIKTGSSFSFLADLYVGINSLLPAEHRKIRIDARLFEIILRLEQHSMHLSTNLDPTTPLCSDDLLKTFKAFHMLWKPVNVALSLDFYSKEIKFTLNSPCGFQNFSHEINILSKISKIKHCFDIDRKIEISLTEINSKIRSIHLFHQVLFETSNDAFLTYAADDGPPLETEVDCFYVASLSIGDYLFVDVIVASGLIEEHTDDSRRIKICARESVYRAYYASAFDSSEITAELEAAIASYKSERIAMDFSPVFFRHLAKGL